MTAALTAAQAGDTIQIIDSGAVFTESIFVDGKNNLKIQGKPGLAVRPAIEGVATSHPLAAQGPVRWFGSSPDTNYDNSGATIINKSTGLTLENLTVKAGTATAALDFRFGQDGQVKDCTVDGTGKVRGAVTANAHSFTNVNFIKGDVCVETEGGTGTTTFTNCLMDGGLHAFHPSGGTIVANGCTFIANRPSGNDNVIRMNNAYGAIDVTLDRCVLRSGDKGATLGKLIIMYIDDRGSTFADAWGVRWGKDPISLTATRCDFIGHNRINEAVYTNTGRIGWVLKRVVLLDNNIYNCVTQYPVSLNSALTVASNGYKLSEPRTFKVDYNVFKNSNDSVFINGFEVGDNNVQLLTPDPLYVDVAAGDYRVAANSVAARMSSTGTRSQPGYTGSQGVGPAVTPTYTELTVSHPGKGGQFNTIQAAIAAAKADDVITIIDNSAPYVEDVDVTTRTLIQGKPGLEPRPTLQGKAAAANVATLKHTKNGGNPYQVVRNLIIERTGTLNHAVLDPRSGNNVLFDNVKVVGAGSAEYAIFTQSANKVFKNSEIIMENGNWGIVMNLSGWMLLQNSKITVGNGTDGLCPLLIQGGNVVVRRCTLSSSGGQTIRVNDANGGTAYLDAQHSVITSHRTGEDAANNLIVVQNGANAGNVRTVYIDNCDLAGAPNGKGTGSGIYINADAFLTTGSMVRDTIFANLAATSIYVGTATNITTGFENYNVFAPANIRGLLGPEAAQLGRGSNFLTADVASLYVDPAQGDYRIRANSAAANFNSTGTPPYAGSQGTDFVNSVNMWTLY